MPHVGPVAGAPALAARVRFECGPICKVECGGQRARFFGKPTGRIAFMNASCLLTGALAQENSVSHTGLPYL